MRDIKSIATACTCNEVSNSLWKLSRVKLINCWSGNIRIQSNKEDRILLRFLRNFLFQLLRDLENSFLLSFNISLIFFVKFTHLFFCLTKRMTVLSFKNPSSELFFHLFIFLLKLVEFLVFEFSLTDKERFSFIKLFNIKLFLFVSKNIGHFLYFFLIGFKLSSKICFSHRIRKSFNYHGKIRGTTSLTINLKFFNFLTILKDSKCQKPHNNHCYTKPTLNIIKSLILSRGIKLLWP